MIPTLSLPLGMHMQAGVGATILLVLLRILQGLAVGGEFTGTMVGPVSL
jgi:hypothetical protein